MPSNESTFFFIVAHGVFVFAEFNAPAESIQGLAREANAFNHLLFDINHYCREAPNWGAAMTSVQSDVVSFIWLRGAHIVMDDLPHELAEYLRHTDGHVRMRSYIPYIPQIPRHIRYQAAMIHEHLQAAQHVRWMTASFREGMQKVYQRPLLLLDGLSQAEQACSAYGCTPESPFFYLLKDTLAVLSLSSAENAAQFISAAFCIKQSVDIDATRMRYGVYWWYMKGLLASINNAGFLGDEGYYEAALRKLSEIEKEKDEFWRSRNLSRVAYDDYRNAFHLTKYQVLIRKTFADSVDRSAEINEQLLGYIRALVDACNDAPQHLSIETIKAWALLQRCALRISEGIEEEVLSDLITIAKEESCYTQKAANALSHYFLHSGSALKSVYWYRQANQQYAPTLTQVRLPIVTQRNPVSPISDRNTVVLEALGVAGAGLGAGAAIHASVTMLGPPALLGWALNKVIDLGACYACNQDKNTKGPNQKSDYEEAFRHCFLSTLGAEAEQTRDKQLSLSPIQALNEVLENIRGIWSESIELIGATSQIWSRRQGLSALKFIKKQWHSSQMIRVVNGKKVLVPENLAVFMECFDALEGNKAQQNELAMEAFFLCYDIFVDLDYRRLGQFHTLCCKLRNIVGDRNPEIGDLFLVLIDFPKLNINEYDGFSWLLSQAIAPDHLDAQLNETTLKEHLMGRFSDRAKIEDVGTFLQQAVNAINLGSKLDTFYLGLACMVLGHCHANDIDIQLECFDMAITLYQIIPNIKFWCFKRSEFWDCSNTEWRVVPDQEWSEEKQKEERRRVRNNIGRLSKAFSKFEIIMQGHQFSKMSLVEQMRIVTVLGQLPNDPTVVSVEQRLHYALRCVEWNLHYHNVTEDGGLFGGITTVMRKHRYLEYKDELRYLWARNKNFIINAIRSGANPNFPRHIEFVAHIKKCERGRVYSNVNKKSWVLDYPIHQAVLFRSIPLIETLIMHGADLDAVNIVGLTALQWLHVSFNMRMRHRAIQFLGDPAPEYRVFKQVDVMLRKFGCELGHVEATLPDGLDKNLIKRYSYYNWSEIEKESGSNFCQITEKEIDEIAEQYRMYRSKANENKKRHYSSVFKSETKEDDSSDEYSDSDSSDCSNNPYMFFGNNSLDYDGPGEIEGAGVGRGA